MHTDLPSSPPCFLGDLDAAALQLCRVCSVIKPGNVMVVGSDSFLSDPRVVLVDFGTAREFVAGVPQTHSVVLTRGYAPLEQYTRQAARGPYIDVYAVAALLYEALTGAPPPDAPERAYGTVLHDVRAVNPEVGEAMGRWHDMRRRARAGPVHGPGNWVQV